MARVNVQDILYPISGVDDFEHIQEMTDVDRENMLLIIDCHDSLYKL